MPGKDKERKRKSEKRKGTGSSFINLSTTYEENVEKNEGMRE